MFKEIYQMSGKWHIWHYLWEFITGAEGECEVFLLIIYLSLPQGKLSIISFSNYFRLRDGLLHLHVLLYFLITFCVIVVPFFCLIWWMVRALQLPLTPPGCVEWRILSHPFVICPLRRCWGTEPVLIIFLSIFNFERNNECPFLFCTLVCSCPYYSCFILPRLRVTFVIVLISSTQGTRFSTLKNHVVLHGEQTGYLLSAKLL